MEHSSLCRAVGEPGQQGSACGGLQHNTQGKPGLKQKENKTGRMIQLQFLDQDIPEVYKQTFFTVLPPISCVPRMIPSHTFLHTAQERKRI